MNKILITGASSDIGKNLIVKYKKRATIYAHYNSSKSFRNFIKSKKIKSRIIPIKANFADKNQFKIFIKKIKKIDIDIIIHIASKKIDLIRFTSLNKKNFDTEIKISFFSIFKILKIFLPNMQNKNQGQIIFVLSSTVLNKKTSPYYAHYNCLKFMLLGLLKSLIAEYKNTAINFTGISPNIIKTNFIKKIDSRLFFLNNSKRKFLKVGTVVNKIIQILENKKKYKGKNIYLS